MAQPHRRPIWILAGLLVIFVSVFVVRGPMRAAGGGADLAHVYAASVLWLEGGNPYDGEQCVEAMRQAGYDNPEHVANGSFYPPPTIAALAPLGLMGWDAARLFWLAINLGGCAMLVWALAYWLDVQDTRARWLLAALVVVAWGPVATTLSLGQLAIVSAACAFVGLVLLDRGRVWLPGLLIGISCLVKPQLGLGFLLLVLLRRDWRAAGIAAVFIAVVSSVGVGRLIMTAPDWAEGLARNIASEQAGGAVLDASLDGPVRYQMIDLRPLLHLVLPGAWVNVSALLLTAVFAGAALWKLLRAGLSRHMLLAVSGVGLLVLLPVYHRYYDAVLLLPLLVLVFNALAHDRRDMLMVVIALAMLPMVLPLPAILAVLHQKSIVPQALHSSWPWQNVVLQVQSWCLLIATVGLVVWTWRKISFQAMGTEERFNAAGASTR